MALAAPMELEGSGRAGPFGAEPPSCSKVTAQSDCPTPFPSPRKLDLLLRGQLPLVLLYYKEFNYNIKEVSTSQHITNLD